MTIGGLDAIIGHSGSQSNAMNYSLFSGTFVATSSSATLTFQSLDVANSNQGIILDGISISTIRTANISVPEPSSAILCGLGLSAVGLLVRRRQASA